MCDRLVDLLKWARGRCDYRHDCEECVGYGKGEDCYEYFLADYLIANGVIVPPCKVGDTVYVISRYYTGTWLIYSCTVEYITKYNSNSFINAVFSRDINFGLNIVEFGKTVFLTREEAEQTLKKLKEGDIK